MIKFVSKNMSYREATRTSTGLFNEPNQTQLMNIKMLAEEVFEPIRIEYGRPIKINSVFRSETVNAAIGGAANSQHTANQGAAMDIEIPYAIAKWAAMYLEYDQLILETGWVHISYHKGHNRKQVLKATKQPNGKMTYAPFQF